MARERLDEALYRVARETDVDELRLRRWVSFIALCGVLQRAIDDAVVTDYHLKGGAALELRFADLVPALQRIWTLACPAILAATGLRALSA